MDDNETSSSPAHDPRQVPSSSGHPNNARFADSSRRGVQPAALGQIAAIFVPAILFT